MKKRQVLALLPIPFLLSGCYSIKYFTLKNKVDKLPTDNFGHYRFKTIPAGESNFGYYYISQVDFYNFELFYETPDGHSRGCPEKLSIYFPFNRLNSVTFDYQIWCLESDGLFNVKWVSKGFYGYMPETISLSTQPEDIGFTGMNTANNIVPTFVYNNCYKRIIELIEQSEIFFETLDLSLSDFGVNFIK